MKFMVLMGLFTFSTLAMACPQMAGNYKCEQKENSEVAKHEVSITQGSDTITIEDKEAGYTEGPIQLKSLTKVSAYNNDLLYRTTCTANSIVIYGSDSDDSKETAVTIKLIKSSKGYKGTWTSQDQTIESSCERI